MMIDDDDDFVNTVMKIAENITPSITPKLISEVRLLWMSRPQTPSHPQILTFFSFSSIK
jgi:hypothetical protein